MKRILVAASLLLGLLLPSRALAVPPTTVGSLQIDSHLTSGVLAGHAGWWWDGSVLGPLWRRADGSDLRLTNYTLQGAYDNGAAATSQDITFSAANGYFRLIGTNLTATLFRVDDASELFEISKATSANRPNGGGAGYAQISAGQLDLTNATANNISFSAGSSAPTFTTKSVGERLTLGNVLDGTHANYAIGSATNSLWLGLPQASSTYTIGIYGGTTLGGTIDGTGALTFPSLTSGGTLTLNGVTGINLQFNGATVVDVGVTTSTAVTLAANKSLAGAAGTGGLSLGSMTGDTTLPTGSVSWSGAPAKTISLVGASTITFTAGTASTWDSADGTVKAALLDRTTAGTLTIGGTATTAQLAANVSLSGAAGTGALSLGSMTGATALPTGNLSWAGASTKTVSIVSTGVGSTITVTAGAASTWDSKDGTVKAALLDRSSAGTLVLGGTATTVQLAANVSLSGAAGTGGLSLGSMTGDTTLPTGNLSWTGAVGKSITLTSAGAINITAGAPSTWDTDDGTLKAALLDRTTAGTLTLGGTATTIQLAANVSLSGAAGTGALSLGSMTGATTLPTGSVSWTAAATKTLTLSAAGAVSITTSSGNETLDAASSLLLGTTNATTVQLGRAGQTTNIYGLTTLGSSSSDTVAFTAQVTGNITFLKGAARTISVAAESTDTAGDNFTVAAGNAGTASAAIGKAGGQAQFQGGTGSNGAAGFAAGAGGAGSFRGGSAGTNVGDGGGTGGQASILGGTGSAAASSGATPNGAGGGLALVQGGAGGTANATSGGVGGDAGDVTIVGGSAAAAIGGTNGTTGGSPTAGGAGGLLTLRGSAGSAGGAGGTGTSGSGAAGGNGKTSGGTTLDSGAGGAGGAGGSTSAGGNAAVGGDGAAAATIKIGTGLGTSTGSIGGVGGAGGTASAGGTNANGGTGGAGAAATYSSGRGAAGGQAGGSGATGGTGGASGTLTLQTENGGNGGAANGGTAGTGGASASMTIKTGNAGTGGNAASGSITIDTGTATGSGAVGTISIGATRGALTLGLANGLITIASQMQVALPATSGGDIASSNTIAPTALVTRVTGTTTIKTITVPTNLNQTGGGGCLFLIPTGALPFDATANIANTAFTATANKMITACYVQAVTKWYLGGY